jgi:hypothetical protein
VDIERVIAIKINRKWKSRARLLAETRIQSPFGLAPESHMEGGNRFATETLKKNG